MDEPEVEFPDWQVFYATEPAERMPWYLPSLDPDVRVELERSGAKGRLLDIGSGPGTQAMALARAGFEVTAIDLAASAVEKAALRAQGQRLKLTFAQDNILAPRVVGPFDVALDRGCFEVLSPKDRARYVENVAGLLRPGGLLVLKVFSEKQGGDDGPHRFSEAQLRRLFEGRFELSSIRETDYQGTVEPPPIAWFCVLRRA